MMKSLHFYVEMSSLFCRRFWTVVLLDTELWVDRFIFVFSWGTLKTPSRGLLEKSAVFHVVLLHMQYAFFSLRFFAFIFARRRLSYFVLIELLGFVCWYPLPNLGSFWLLFFLSSTFFPLPFSLSLFRLGLRLHKIGMLDIVPQVFEVLFCVFCFVFKVTFFLRCLDLIIFY